MLRRSERNVVSQLALSLRRQLLTETLTEPFGHHLLHGFNTGKQPPAQIATTLLFNLDSLLQEALAHKAKSTNLTRRRKVSL